MIQKIFPTEKDCFALHNTPVDPATQKDDFFDYSKVVVKKPWGYEYLIYQNEVVAVWILYIKQGFQTSMHCHPNKKTSLIVLEGEAQCGNLQGEKKLSPGEGCFINKGVFHQTASLSEEGIIVMEIETPVNKRDLVRLKDTYGRVGKGYESVDHISFNVQNYNYIRLIEEQVYYNVRKRFGQCSISLVKFRDGKKFKENSQKEGWDAVCILKGRIINENNQVILDTGDTIDSQTMREYQNPLIEDEIEAIIIKKKDTLTKLSDYVVSLLEQKKHNEIFVVPGSANLHLLDSIGRNINMTYICTQTEQAATMAAESYAKLTGKVAVVVLSSGCGSTHAITGVADAWVDSTPLLIISGQSQSDQSIEGSKLRQFGIQEINSTEIVKPITKYAMKVKDPNTIRYNLEKALFIAQEGRPGPVWIDLPIDIQGMIIDEEELTIFKPELTTKDNNELRIKVKETYFLLQKAQRPVILAGEGIRLARAEEEFLELAGSLGIPILTTKRTADIIWDEHPLWFGRPGAYGQRSANFILQNADLLLSVGARLSLSLTGRNFRAFARKAKKIIVDIDPEELRKNTILPDIAIEHNAKEFVEEMLRQKKDTSLEIAAWKERCLNWKEKYASEPGHFSSEKVSAYFFMHQLSQALEPGAIMTIDGGSSTIFAMHQFRFKPKQRLISSPGLDNMSFGLPGAIGACIGSGGKTVYCICEDRGFQKNLSELETIINYRLPIKIFILNHQGYSYIKKNQKEYFGGRFVGSTIKNSNPDLVRIAQAYGFQTLKITSNHELAESMGKIMASEGPIIVQCDIDENQDIFPRIAFAVKPDGKWSAKPLEDMYPFLNRDEFKENMIIDTIEEE